MIRKTVCLILCTLLLAGCELPLSGEKSTPTPTLTVTYTPTATSTLRPSPTNTPIATVTQAAVPGSFADLVGRMERQDPTLDFTKLRMAYAASELYDPYKYKLMDLLDEISEAFGEKDYEKAIGFLDQALDINPISYNVNLAGYAIYSEMGNDTRKQYHQYVLNGVAESIAQSGDGKTKDTAFVVVTIEEEYLLLDWFGLTHGMQSLDDSGEQIFDIQEATDPETGETYAIYFNIDLIFQWLDSNY